MRLGSALVLLALLLGACGNTTRRPHASEPPGTAGSAGSAFEPVGGSATDGADSAAGQGGAPPVNCAYPPLVDPLRTERDITDYVLSSTVYPLPVDAPHWGAFQAAYDVNGDWVDDLVFTELTQDGPKLRLLVSGPPPRSLEHALQVCPDLEALPAGRVFLRHLDADHAPDFVIATDDRLHVFANRPEGFVSILDYAWPQPNLRTSVLDVAVADITDDYRPSLVVGYDRLESEAIGGIALGAMSFLSSFAVPELLPWKEVRLPLDGASDQPVFTGYLTTGSFGVLTAGEVAVLGLARGETSGLIGRAVSFYEELETMDVQAPGFTDSVIRLFRTRAVEDSHDLWILGRQALYRLNIAAVPPTFVVATPTVFEAQLSHDLGGGPVRPRAFLLDIDRDDDADFIESTSDRFALHVALDQHTFAPAQVFEAALLASERPFLTVGPVLAILEQPPGGPGTPVIRTLVTSK